MSVLVVARRRARPGEEGRLLEVLSAMLTHPSPALQSRRQVRLFQGVDDPTVLLRIGEWESRAAIDTRVQEVGATAQIDALCVAPVERFYFDRLWFYADMSQAAVAVICGLVQSPTAATAAVLDVFLQVARPALQALPDFVEGGLYQDQGDPNHVFGVQGWRSLEAVQAYLGTLGGEHAAALRGLGATVEIFVGHARARVDRHSG